MTVAEALDRATTLHQRGQFAEAEKLYRQILTAAPNQPNALHYLGVLANQVGRADVSVALIEKSLKIQPDATAFSNYGEALRSLGRNEEAILAYDRALAIQPNFATAWSNKGLVLRTVKRLEESEEACRRAVELDGNFAGAYQNLCNVLGDRGKYREAIEAGKRAAELAPNHADTHADLGAAYVEAADLGNAISSFERAIALNPESADAHHNLAQALLLTGDFLRGWEEYEWRWKSPSFPSAKRNFSQAIWNGEAIGGQTILLHAEQGFGDTIMFGRYLPMVRERLGEATIVMEVQGELLTVLRGIPGGTRWIGRGEELPAFDWHCPLLSLPRVFGTDQASIPAAIPYLVADAEKVAHWRERLLPYPRKIGIVWAGRPTHTNDHNRSTSLAAFGAMARSDVAFFSLQKGPAAEQSANPPAEMELIDWTSELHDFSDTAAFIANLDLVISVDTSIVHLAGAMGKAAWVLIPYACDWRWLRACENTSPWYRTLRLFRQREPNTWAEVLGRVAGELDQRLRRAEARPTGEDLNEASC